MLSEGFGNSASAATLDRPIFLIHPDYREGEISGESQFLVSGGRSWYDDGATCHDLFLCAGYFAPAEWIELLIADLRHQLFRRRAIGKDRVRCQCSFEDRRSGTCLPGVVEDLSRVVSAVSAECSSADRLLDRSNGIGILAKS